MMAADRKVNTITPFEFLESPAWIGLLRIGVELEMRVNNLMIEIYGGHTPQGDIGPQVFEIVRDALFQEMAEQALAAILFSRGAPLLQKGFLN